MCDLRDLRNLIVHRAGTKGQSDQHRNTAKRLSDQYPGRVIFPDNDWSWYGNVWVSLPLCRDFISSIEAVFDRVFDALELPPRHRRQSS